MNSRKAVVTFLASFCVLAMTSVARADDDPPAPGGPEMKEHMEKMCKEHPQRCEEMKKRHEEMRAMCEKDPQACKKKHEEMRERMHQRMEERCKQNPEKCKEWKEKHKPCDHDKPGEGGEPKPE